jgi:hypothetical protein
MSPPRLEPGPLEDRVYLIMGGKYHDITDALGDFLWEHYRISPVWDVLCELGED